MTAALVLGGASCLWRDVEAALDLGRFDGVVACNDAAAVWPGRVDCFVSLHAEKMGYWLERRDRAGLPEPDRIWGHDTAKRGVLRISERVQDYVAWKFEGQHDSGSSGLFALKAALIDMGFNKAVLCGVPLTQTGAHFFDLTPWGGAEAHKRGFKQALPVIRDRARSMSGWTAEVLGQPTKEWLAG